MTAYPAGVGPPTPIWALSAEHNAEAMKARRRAHDLARLMFVVAHPKRWEDVTVTELPTAAATFARAAIRAGFTVESRERSDGLAVNVKIERDGVRQVAIWKRTMTTARVRLDDGTLIYWQGVERIPGPWTTAGVRVSRHEHVGITEAKARWAAILSA